MQTITTKYCGPTDYKGSRIIATASGSGSRIVHGIDNAKSVEANHRDACLALMAKMGWASSMIAGDTKTGKVWVFASGSGFPEDIADPAADL